VAVPHWAGETGETGETPSEEEEPDAGGASDTDGGGSDDGGSLEGDSGFTEDGLEEDGLDEDDSEEDGLDEDDSEEDGLDEDDDGDELSDDGEVDVEGHGLPAAGFGPHGEAEPETLTEGEGCAGGRVSLSWCTSSPRCRATHSSCLGS